MFCKAYWHLETLKKKLGIKKHCIFTSFCHVICNCGGSIYKVTQHQSCLNSRLLTYSDVHHEKNGFKVC